ncbi:PAS domain S-box-containing protein/diguanylate cyclase (GGDEF)-like protein [Acidovorax sp. 56]|uniref:PAS domain-containing protein n=1 Tax=Acidovorax sp. 56 TaxID=2035205 RepID=UPI000C16FF71|nr:PAS domain-containing protein [Acidovorax sp. 56]PIF26460.1 PAS domain S-box-containing protein/diguanylate cyclase (GGDEF)-like protein [Acidovorax sp. 56]
MKKILAHWRIVGALVLLLLACAAYWWQLLGQQRDQLAFAQAQTELRASQVSRTLAVQVGTLMGGLEYLARNLAVLYESDPQHAFQLAAGNALATFPPGSLLQIAVAAANGQIVYSSLTPSDGLQTNAVSIEDRAHFQVHTLNAGQHIYISRPTLGRLSGQWSVQMSYPVEHQGRFGGVVVLSVNPEYLSRNFREVFTQGKDVALLVRADGAYLARSHLQSEVLDQNMPPESEFLSHPERSSGQYQSPASVDGIERLYAWQRLTNYPLVVSVGLGRDQAFATTRIALRESRWRNALGTGALLLAAIWIAILFARQKQDRTQLQRHKQRCSLALEGGKLGTWYWPLGADEMQFDVRWPTLLGLPPQAQQLNQQQLQAFMHPSDWVKWREALQAHARGETDYFEAEPRLRHQSGQWIWVHLRGKLVDPDAMETTPRIAGTYLDVTQRHEAEAARAEMQMRLSKLLAQVPGTVYQFRLRTDGSACFPYASPGIMDIYGITPELAQTDAHQAFASVHPEDMDRLAASIRQSADTLEAWSFEWRQIRPDGEVRWLAGRANPEREPDGSTLWHGYIHDVTEQHAMVETLRRSEARLRLTMAAVQDGLWEWDTHSDTILMDTRCHEMLGYATLPAPLHVNTWKRLVHPDDRASVLTTLQRQVALGQPFDVEVRLRTQEGTWRWVEIRGQVAPDAAGRSALVIGTQTDITQRMQEAHLRRALLDNAAAALLITTPERTIALANQRAVETFSEDGLPLQGKSTQALHRHEASYAQFRQYVDTVRLHGAVQVEYLLRTASGALRWFSMRGTPLDPEHPEGDIVWTLVDTTERRETEEALATAQAHLLEVIQHFPGGVLVQNQAGDAVVINQAMCDLFNVPARSKDLVGCDREALLALVPPEARAVLPSRDNPHNEGSSASYEVTLQDGRTTRIDLILMRTGRGDDLGRLWLAQDITERRRHERTLERLATTDTLTSLPNRRAFMARLEAEITHIAHGAPPAMVLMLDLDHFKRVNDTWGHATGDQVLMHLAKLLRGNLLRKDDMAGRLGGEEFAVLLPDTTVPEGLGIAERLRAALEQSQILSDTGQTIRVTMSVGACTVGTHSGSTLASADAALYEAKNTGRNRIVQAPASGTAAPELPHGGPAKSPH